MYSKLSVTNEIQSIQSQVHAQRGRRKTYGRSAGLILHPQSNNCGSKIPGEPQRDHRANGVLVDDEVFVQTGHGEGLRRGNAGWPTSSPSSGSTWSNTGVNPAGTGDAKTCIPDGNDKSTCNRTCWNGRYVGASVHTWTSSFPRLTRGASAGGGVASEVPRAYSSNIRAVGR